VADHLFTRENVGHLGFVESPKYRNWAGTHWIFFWVTFLRSPESGDVFGEICEVVKSKDGSLIEEKNSNPSIPIRNSLVIVKTTHPQWTTMVS